MFMVLTSNAVNGNDWVLVFDTCKKSEICLCWHHFEAIDRYLQCYDCNVSQCLTANICHYFLFRRNTKVSLPFADLSWANIHPLGIKQTLTCHDYFYKPCTCRPSLVALMVGIGIVASNRDLSCLGLAGLLFRRFLLDFADLSPLGEASPTPLLLRQNIRSLNLSHISFLHLNITNGKMKASQNLSHTNTVSRCEG